LELFDDQAFRMKIKLIAIQLIMIYSKVRKSLSKDIVKGFKIYPKLEKFIALQLVNGSRNQSNLGKILLKQTNIGFGILIQGQKIVFEMRSFVENNLILIHFYVYSIFFK